MGRNLYFEDELTEENFNFFMLKRLIRYAGKYRMEYIRIILLMVGTSFLGLLPTAVNMLIINQVLPDQGTVPEDFAAKAVVLLSLWFSLSVGALVANYIMTKMSTRLGNSIICNLREDLFDKLMELGFEYYDSRPTGKILVRVTNYTDEIAGFFINEMTRVVSNLFLMVIAFVCVAIIEIRLAGLTLLVSIPLFIPMWFLSVSLHRRSRVERNKNSNRTAFVAEDINGLEVIKAFNREEINDRIFSELSGKYHRAFVKSTHVREVFYPLAHGIIQMMSTMVLYVGALFITTHHLGAPLTLGALVSITTYMQQFSNAVFVICQQLQSITNISANIERIFEVLDTPADIVEAVDAVPLEHVRGRVDFEGVDFAYVQGMPVLEKINLTVEPGQMIALVGPTGAGKTTVVSLLSRFYDVDRGSVRIDGIDVRDITIESLRRHVGVMMQDTFLFRGTIMENIRFSRPDATDEECIAAAKNACAHDFIMKREEGYETALSDNGSELSGGEKQLISFARLLLAEPEIIVLDEATSNIDTRTEQAIQKVFTTALKGRTSFIIAHRLSTIRHADRILYIGDKGILEDGSHEELMAKGGCYARLVNHSA